MRSYKRIPESKSGHLSGNIKTIRGPQYREFISNFFPWRAGGLSRNLAAGVFDLQKMKRLYYDPSQPSTFSSRRKFDTAAQKRGHATDKITEWLLRHYFNTL
jgi:hypothetical protein